MNDGKKGGGGGGGGGGTPFALSAAASSSRVVFFLKKKERKHSFSDQMLPAPASHKVSHFTDHGFRTEKERDPPMTR